jgi:hemolysin activation/secretion protein
MALSEEDDTVNALVNVQDSSPHKVFVTLDNTGTPSTGMYRTGVGYQNNNMFNRDQALTLNYITSPKHVSDVTQVSASYRLPIYSMGDSVDFLAAYSDTNAGTTNVGSPGGPLLSFSGKGDVYGAHYNHYLARRGDYTSKVIGGLDYRLTYSNCILAAAACNNQPPEINLLPFTLSYGGTLSKPTVINDYIASIVHNIPAGAKGGIDVFGGPNGARPGVKDNFNTLHLNETVSGVLPKDWQYRVAGNVQYGDALIPSEKLGLVGANAVRGFQEREFSTDEGYISNFELYTPDIAQLLNIQNGSFRFLGFIDKANGWNKTLTGELGNRINVGSFGLGFRYTQDKLLTFKLDVARVYCKDTDGSTCTSSNVLSKTGDTRGHVSVMANW